MRDEGFPPIIGDNPKVLILGTFPGKESLKQNQYYAHSRNTFWYIICKLLEIDPQTSYEHKKNIMMKNGLAVWDVLKACEREGSSDQAIKGQTKEINDFKTLFAKYRGIKYIFFNGGNAEKEFKKLVLPLKNIHHALEYHRLPSTSPAMASLTKDQKYKEWLKLFRQKALKSM